MKGTIVSSLRIGFLLVGVVVGLGGQRAEAQFSRVQITNTKETLAGGGGCFNNRPAISAGGTRIAFVSSCDLTPGRPGNADHNGEVFLFDTTTGRFTQITNSVDENSFQGIVQTSVDALSVNADGTRIAFLSTVWDLEFFFPPPFLPLVFSTIVLFDTTTGVFTDITATRGTFASNPAMNGAGTLIAFGSGEDLAPGSPGNADRNQEIYLFDTATDRVTQITNTVGGCFNGGPSISAVGTRIAFVSSCDLTPGHPGNADHSHELFVFDTTTGAFTQITDTTGGAFEKNAISMNAAGTRIAFVSDRDLAPGSPGNADGNRELFVFDAATGRWTQITDTVGRTFYGPSMDATGIWIAITAVGTATEVDTFVLFDTMTGLSIPIAPGGCCPLSRPSINAAGTRIAFASDRDVTPGQPGNADHNQEIFLASQAAQGDFDGDLKKDLAVYRPASGQWFIFGSATGFRTEVFGAAAASGLDDIPVPADFDGDGKADLAVYRQATGQWFIFGSATGLRTEVFGAPVASGLGDIPVPADFDGDGKADLAVYRPATGQWFIFGSVTGFWTGVFGAPAASGLDDTPVPADFDGDGKTDLAVYRQATGQWFIFGSATGFRTETFGAPAASGLGDTPVPADFDGDGKADLAIYRQATGQWFVLGSATGLQTIPFGGASDDIPVPADFDGDGKADRAVYRTSTGEWFVLRSVDGQAQTTAFGAPGDVPLP